MADGGHLGFFRKFKIVQFSVPYFYSVSQSGFMHVSSE